MSASSVLWLAALCGAVMGCFEVALLTQTRVSFRLGLDVLPSLAVYVAVPLAATLAGGLLARRDPEGGRRRGLLVCLAALAFAQCGVFAYLELTPLPLPQRELGTAAFVVCVALVCVSIARRRRLSADVNARLLVVLWGLAICLYRAPRQIVLDLASGRTDFAGRDALRTLGLVLASAALLPIIGFIWRRPRLGLGLAAPAVAALGLAFTPPPPPATPAPASPPRGDVYLVILDSLRYDHTSLAGGDGTPALAALAARGLSFDRAHSPSVETQYSLPLMLGQDVEAGHGRTKTRWNAMRATWPDSLPARLATAGYEINLLSDFAYLALDLLEVYRWDHVAARPATWFRLRSLAPALGAMLSRDYERMDYVVNDRQPYPEGEGPAEALDRLLAARKTPGFFLIHLGAPHEPYDYPPYAARTLPPHDRASHEAALRRFGREMGRVRPEDAASYRLLYARGVRAADERLGELLGTIARHGRDRDALIVVTADHGESLGEGGYLAHGLSLHAREHHVPLVIAGPGIPAGRRVDRPVSCLRLADSIAGWARLPGAGETSLLHEVDAAGAPEPVLVWTPGALVIEQDGWRLVWTREESLLRSPAAWAHRQPIELYEVGADPEEQRDVYRPDHPAVAVLLPIARRLHGGATVHSTRPRPPPSARPI